MEMSLIAPKYFKKFKCIGGDCEANCCEYPWRIDVNKKHYYKLESKFKKDNKLAEFHEVFEKQDHGTEIIATDSKYAFIKKCDGESCRFLNSEKLCGLALTHGFDLLPDVCSVYPRISNGIEGIKIEANLSLSCPEAARKCLLSESDIVWQGIQLSDMGSSRINPQFYLNGQTFNNYNKHVDVIKSYGVSILQNKLLSLTEKLFILAFFGNKTKEYMNQGIKKDISGSLEKTLKLMSSESTITTLRQQLKSISLPTNLSIIILKDILSVQIKIKEDGLLSNLFRLTLDNFSYLRTADLKKTELYSETLWDFYIYRKTSLLNKYGNLVENRITQYCTHFWLTEWYQSSPNILIHVRKCLIFKAIVSFLFYTSPELNYVISDKKNKKGIGLIDEAIVRVVYSFTRDIGNTPLAISALEDELNNKNIVELASILVLVDF